MFEILAENFNGLLVGMTVLAVAVFIALFFVKAGYGRFYTKRQVLKKRCSDYVLILKFNGAVQNFPRTR